MLRTVLTSKKDVKTVKEGEKMGNRNSNFPQMQLEQLDKPAVQEMVSDLRQLYDMGRPKTDEELKQRIDDYFQFCQNSAIRPGVESLCLSLHITRTTLFNWSYGIGCDKNRQEIIACAKGFISAFLEQASLSGRISPPTGIFLLKNWCSYRDVYSFESAAEEASGSNGALLSREEIAARFQTQTEFQDAPDAVMNVDDL